MKKNLFLSAAALAGAMTMVSCSSEDEMKPQNGKREEVKTSFTLSVGSVKPGTRMTATSVQAEGTVFQGMEGIKLFPFIGEPDGSTPITISPINLPNFTSFEGLTQNAKVYNDVSIPIGVDHFVFYGMIADGKKGDGRLAVPYTNTTLFRTLQDNMYFDLVPRTTNMASADQINNDENAKKVLEVLNGVITDLTNLQTNDGSNDETYGKYLEAWKSMRAGSSASVLALAEALYNSIYNVNDVVITDANCPTLTGKFNATQNPDTKYFTLAWNSDPEFPGTYNLPDGAVVVQYDGAAFKYVQGNVEGLNVPTLDKFVYPAQLAYFVKTQAMVSNQQQFGLNGIYNVNNNDWNWNEVQTEGIFNTGKVTMSTQSVVLKNQIQFAVGQLQTKVRVKPNVAIYDNGSSVSGAIDEAPQLVQVPAEGYKLTGVLIGGQKQVDWQFLPKGTIEYTIYDNDMTSSIVAKQQPDYSAANYTLALETAQDADIKLCLEFENTGNPFFGVDHQVIPTNGKFYLITDLLVEGTQKVFEQDHITIAKLTIGEGSLQSAYNVIPDLRSPKLELGLSVDLEWQEGITFEQEF